jgi:hypothetical protein
VGRLTAAERSQRARIAALTLHASGGTNVAAAHAAAEARFYRQAETEAAARGEELTEQQLARRAGQLKRLYFARLAFSSAKARRARS